jgi:hypothetical protein
MITSHPFYKAMKMTLDNLTTDDLEKKQVCIGPGKLIPKLESMKDGYVDDAESAGTTLLVQKAQGAPLTPEDIVLGGTSRYWPRTMGKMVSVTEETMDDVKYFDEIINPSKRLLASGYKTQDIDVSTLISLSTSAIGGYDQSTLTSTTHALPGGGTESNRFATYMTPSIPALALARAQLALQKGPNGLPQGQVPERIVCPEVQVDVWKVLLGSEKSPGNNFNDINIAKTYKLGDPMGIKWLDGSSTTQWGLLTDADNGLRAFQKKKITSITWTDNACLVLHHGVYYRMAIGWSNWRAWFQGNV